MKLPDEISQLYPLTSEDNLLPDVLRMLTEQIGKKIKSPTSPRYGSLSSIENYDSLSEKYSELPIGPSDVNSVVIEMTDDLFNGVLRWRSPHLQHNVGAPVNTAASAMYSLALDENIFNIDDGLAGNALMSESAVTNILSDLAGLESPGAGFFVFGGTATNLYAAKVGLQKASPSVSKTGGIRNIKMFVTEEAHFTHRLSADWLGIGTDNVVEIKANHDRSSSLVDAEQKIRSAIENDQIISVIMLNGGTTYNQTIDPISDFVSLRDRLVDEYNLSYKPHIHVDAVIGWAWLFFRNYDFNVNPLRISQVALDKIKIQCDMISDVRMADSWGADFHKGIGGCPVDCSVIMFNNPKDIFAISKSSDQNLATHQLATELANHAPSEFTFETSRSAGTALAALATLRSHGLNGFRVKLARLIEGTVAFRDELSKKDDIRIANEYSLGYSTMVRIYPPQLAEIGYARMDMSDDKNQLHLIEKVNDYIKKFYKWDFETRIAKNQGPSPSFSSGFMNHMGHKVSALKYYPTSPHYDVEYAKLSAKVLVEQKERFDTEIWPQIKND